MMAVMVSKGRTHALKEEVDVLIVVGLHHVEEGDDVVMVRELLQEDDLAECALRVGGVLERAKDLLEGEDLLGLLVLDLPHNAVSLKVRRGAMEDRTKQNQ